MKNIKVDEKLELMTFDELEEIEEVVCGDVFGTIGCICAF